MVRSAFITAGLGVVVLTALTPLAYARGGHRLGRGPAGYGIYGAAFAGDRRNGNDAYIKAASEERDKLLDTKLKSICRGC